EMCENWGYERLAKHTRKESIEEMRHAEKLMEHILYLDGTPNMSDYFKINIGQNVKAQLQNDLDVEYDAVKRLNAGIETCVKAGDNGSRDLLQKILVDEEEHIDWLEAQMHAIQEMGIENYLTQQLHEKKEWFIGVSLAAAGQLAKCNAAGKNSHEAAEECSPGREPWVISG